MFKLKKVGIAAALGLALCLSLFTSGAFAQSVQQSGVSRVVVTSNQVPQGDWNSWHPVNTHRPPSHGWCGLHVFCPTHVKTRCVRVTRWVRFGHSTRRVTRLECRRY